MRGLAAFLALAGICSVAAAAQAVSPSTPAHPIAPRKQKFYYHYEWTRGAVLTAPEWKRGASVGHPRRQGLPPPPKGEEWREIDRNYILASQSTHAIVRVVAAPHPTAPGRSGGEP